MKPALTRYLREAFCARPIGMFIPPNWVALGLFGLLGLLNPGVWLVGAGLELGYLYWLINNRRFRRYVEGKAGLARESEAIKLRDTLMRRLAPEDRDRYAALERRCRSILTQQTTDGQAGELLVQGQGLGRLLWIYLRLLVTGRTLSHLLEEQDRADAGRSIAQRIAAIESRLSEDTLSEELRKSLSGQIEILRQREERRREASEKRSFVDAELTRVEEQVELIREQAIVAADPNAVSRRIDEIAATLGGTTRWISEQQRLIGPVEDMLTAPAPLVAAEESA